MWPSHLSLGARQTIKSYNAEMTDSALISPDPDALKIQAAQGRLLHEQVIRSILGGAGVAVCYLLIATTQSLYSATTITAISVIYVSVAVLRWYVYTLLDPANDSDENIVAWTRKMPWLLLLTGVVWGVIIFAVGYGSSITIACLSIALAAGLSSGAVGAMAVVHKCYLYYSMPMTTALTIVLLLGDTFTHQLLALPVLLFMAVNYGFSLNIAETTEDNISTKLKNDELVELMSQQQAVLQEQNEEIHAAMLEIDEANKAKSLFLASASHDLAQPLHSMKLFLLALESESDREKQQVLIENARKSSDAMSDLFTALLDVSKLDANQVTVEPESKLLTDVLAPLIPEFKELAESRGLTFINNVVEVSVYADPTIVQRICRNLLHNALAYTSGGTVTLGAEVSGSTVTITVNDTGIGIPDSEQKLIFNTFYQVHNTERDKKKGLGLGLSIVARLAALSDFQLRLRSKVGQGTTVEIDIPKGQVLSSTGSEDEPETGEYTTSKTVLFIDDDESTRLAMRYVLEGFGLKAVVVEDLEAASRAFNNNTAPDLLISDYRLRNGKTGVEAALLLRKQFGRTLPVLIITGDTSPESLLDVESHQLDIMYKLSNEEELETKIRSLI